MAMNDIDKQIDWQERVFGMEVEGRWEDEFGGYARAA